MCIQDTLAEAGQEEWFVKCSSKYSDDDLVRIGELGTATAAMKCFLDDFSNACRDYVRAEIMNYGASLAATASG